MVFFASPGEECVKSVGPSFPMANTDRNIWLAWVYSSTSYDHTLYDNTEPPHESLCTRAPASYAC